MAKEKKPTLLFLMETKSRHYKLEHIRVKLGFDRLFVVDPVGQNGVLALLWKESGNVEIQNFTRRRIHAMVTESEGGAQWSLAFMVTQLLLGDLNRGSYFTTLKLLVRVHGCV